MGQREKLAWIEHINIINNINIDRIIDHILSSVLLEPIDFFVEFFLKNDVKRKVFQGIPFKAKVRLVIGGHPEDLPLQGPDSHDRGSVLYSSRGGGDEKKVLSLGKCIFIIW